MKKLDIEAARAVAFRFLGYSARTQTEMEQRLARDEFPPEIIAQIVTEMQALGYLDDAGFARHWVDDRADRKRYGRTRLAAELNRKGIDRETAEGALDAIAEDDEFRRALEAAEGRWARVDVGGLDVPALLKEKNRISGFLMRRGFSWPTIKKVLDALLENNT